MPDLLGQPAPGEVVHDVREPRDNIPLRRGVGRIDALGLDCGIGDLARRYLFPGAQRFIEPLRPRLDCPPDHQLIFLEKRLIAE
jgi:hypothetical protein